MRGPAEDQQQSKLFYDLCAIVLTILESPHRHLPFSLPSSLTPATIPSTPPPPPRRATPPPSQITPAGLASLFLGVSLTLMLCGSVTFVIGFILMPWVIGFIMVVYLVGIISNLSQLGRFILLPPLPMPPPPPPQRAARSPKQMSGEGFRCSMLGIFPVVPF